MRKGDARQMHGDTWVRAILGVFGGFGEGSIGDVMMG